jgi:hypothetical protein
MPQERAQQEEPQADEIHALLAGGEERCERHPAERHRVGGADPDFLERGADGAAHLRQRDVDDRRVMAP